MVILVTIEIARTSKRVLIIMKGRTNSMKGRTNYITLYKSRLCKNHHQRCEKLIYIFILTLLASTKNSLARVGFELVPFRISRPPLSPSYRVNGDWWRVLSNLSGRKYVRHDLMLVLEDAQQWFNSISERCSEIWKLICLELKIKWTIYPCRTRSRYSTTVL